MAEDFDWTQLLAIHLKIQCAADQVVGGSFAALFDRIKKIGLHCAHASSAIVYVGRMDQRPFPFQKLRHSLDRQTQQVRSEEHTSELQSLMRISYAVFCLKKKT